MDGTTRLKIGEINKNLICTLCGGYLVDATTIIECLHSFCRTCVVTYLKTSKTCPTCDTVVHKTRPHQNIRSDLLLQDLVYKLVPGLYKDEMRRRREFYTKNYDAAPKRPGEERGDEMSDRFAYTEAENISLALYLLPDGGGESPSFRRVFSSKEALQSRMERRIKEAVDIRYLQCKAAVTVGLLKKFVRLKYGLPTHFQVEMFYNDESLRDSTTLCDVAYTYNWRRRSPMALTFCVCKTPPSRSKSTRLLSQLNPVRDKTSGTQVTKKDLHKPIPKLAEVTDTLKNDFVKEEISCIDNGSPVTANKPQEIEDIVKMETESPSKNETKAMDIGPPPIISSVLKNSILSNTDKTDTTSAFTEKVELKHKLSDKSSKVKTKYDSNKCNRPPTNSISAISKKVKTEAESTESQHTLKSPSSLNSTTLSNVDIKVKDQCRPTTTLPSSQPDKSLSSTSTPVFNNNNLKECSEQSEQDIIATKSSQFDHSNIQNKASAPKVGVSEHQTDNTSSNQPDHSVKSKSTRPSKSVLGKRPASNPVLIAPTPAKVPSLSAPAPSVVSKIIKIEDTQPPLQSPLNSGSNTSCSNHNKPTINLVSMLPVGLPTFTPTSRKMAIPRLPKTSKNSKSFTVAHLLGTPSPKRTRVRMAPSSVARIKPPVLNYISVNTSSSTTPVARENAAVCQVTAPPQTPYVPSPSGFMSSLMLSQPQLLSQSQLFLSSNDGTSVGLRLSPALQAPAPGMNTSALCVPQIIPTSINAASKSSSSPSLTLPFSSIGPSSNLPSLTNLTSSQSPFLSSTLPSVPASQLFSSISSSMAPSFSIPVVSSSPASVSLFTVSSSMSTASFTFAPSSNLSSAVSTTSSTSSVPSLLASSSSSVSSAAQINSFLAPKEGIAALPTSISSPPPAASASPTPAAVPVQQSQTQGADSGFACPAVKNTRACPNSSKTSRKRPYYGQKSKAKVSSVNNHTVSTSSKSKGTGGNEVNISDRTSSTQNCSSLVKTTHAFAQSSVHCNGKLHSLSNGVTVDPRHLISDSLKTENHTLFTGVKKAKPKNLVVSKEMPSCTSSATSILSSPCTPSCAGSSTSSSKSSVSPASALAQLCITSPTSQSTSCSSLSSSSIPTLTSFTFPSKSAQILEKSRPKNGDAKDISNGHLEEMKCFHQAQSTIQDISKCVKDNPSASDKPKQISEASTRTPICNSSPTSPTGRPSLFKPKKKIADIANTLHKRVSESLYAQLSCSSPQIRTPSSLGNKTFTSSTLPNSNKSSSNPSFQKSNGLNKGSMILPVTKSPSLTLSSSSVLENKPCESVSESRSSPIITCARHELPGRPLSLQNATLSKGSPTYMTSKAEAKRSHKAVIAAAAVVRASTLTKTPTADHNGHQIEEQPLNLVKRDDNFPLVASGLLLS